MNDNNLLVSVIIPAFNSERYLSSALDSVLNQTYEDFEIILVDDGSTDRTAEIAKGYGDKLVYVYQDNQGVSAARNHGLRLAKGELIAFLDSDDLWYPTKLEQQAKRLADDIKIGAVYCDSTFVDSNGKEINNYVRETKFHRGSVDIELFCDHFLMTPSIVFRSELLAQTGIFDEALRVGEDYDFFLRLLSCCCLEVVEEKLWARRVITNSLSRQNFVLDAETDLRTLHRFCRLHPAFYAKHRSRVRRRFADYYFSFGYRCLETGMNRKGFMQFLRAFYYEHSWRSIKNMLYCAIPHAIRRKIKTRRQAG